MTEASGNNRGHAQYAPSAAYRWMACPASVKATAGMESLSSRYAAEGTVAHHVLEGSMLDGKFKASNWIGEIIDVEVEGKLGGMIVTKEMAEAVQVCLDFIKPIVEEADEWHPEQQITLELFGAPDCYGTGDFMARVTIAGRIIIIDYKHGAGTLVEVIDNPQLKIYGLGALLRLGKGSGITHVQTTIVQPRAPHPQGPIRSHTYTVAELMDFGQDVLDAIDACEADNPPFVPGDHCKWCGIEDSCAARAKAIAGDIVAVISEMSDGMVLTPTEQEQFLQRIESLGLEDFVGALRGAIHKRLEDGGSSDRYKLVAKRASRVWLRDESQTIAKLQPLLAKKNASRVDLYTSEFKSPSEVEKVIGKGVEARAVLEGLTARVSSGTNLVPIDDPRQKALVNAEDEFDSLTSD